MDFKEKIERANRLRKRQKLIAIIQAIMAGKINSKKSPQEPIFNGNGTRQIYISPKDRATHNYGYMEADEMMAGTPFVGES